MKTVSIKSELENNEYPGRGIILGRSEDGTKAIAAYFIMGRSENSRNRVFVEDGEGLKPKERPQKFAEGKALEVSKRFPNEYVLGFDTLVIMDSKALGKPKDPSEALSMLKLLNGSRHKVISGVAIAHKGKILESSKEITDVIFRHNTEQALQEYVNSGEPMDKAGAYAIQGIGARLVKAVNGCFYNVVGLPVAKTLDLIDHLGESNV